MTIMALADCCRQLAIDPKTLRRWLAQAQVPLLPHPADARQKGITTDQLRQLATTHHRRLPVLPGEDPLPPPSATAPAPSPLPADLLQSLRELPAQLTILQQQVAALTRLLPAHEPPPAQPPVPAPPTHSAPRARPPAKVPPQPAHVIPRVEFTPQGRYVVLCPQCGLLPIEPDTQAWFAWVAQQTSFRFVGTSGYFTAHHEWRVPNGAWRAHRKIRNHTSILRLAPNQNLTIAVLEQAAQALQALLS